WTLVDGDVLLKDLIVRSELVGRDGVDRALAEVSRRRASSQDADLARFVVETGLLDKAALEKIQREARQGAIRRGPSQRLTPDKLTETLELPNVPKVGEAVGFRTEVMPTIKPGRRSTGRLDTVTPSPTPVPAHPTPAPPPVIPTPHTLSGSKADIGRI